MFDLLRRRPSKFITTVLWRTGPSLIPPSVANPYSSPWPVSFPDGETVRIPLLSVVCLAELDWCMCVCLCQWMWLNLLRFL